MAQQITLSSTVVKNPNKIDYAWYNITEAERTADGTMHITLIAKKRKWTLNYTVLTQTEKEAIMDIIDSSSMVFTFKCYNGTTQESASVYVGEISGTPWVVSGEWKWKDFQFALIEI